jgi:hypothetical protein
MEKKGLDLTIILTTSYCRSCPNTGLIETVIRSFELVEGLSECKLIVTCDGVKEISDQEYEEGQKYSKGRKKGFLSHSKVKDYREYISTLKSKSAAHERPFHNSHIMDLETHHGFTYAVKRALAEVQTEFVMVV